jgi:hypothetical protein
MAKAIGEARSCSPASARACCPADWLAYSLSYADRRRLACQEQAGCASRALAVSIIALLLSGENIAAPMGEATDVVPLKTTPLGLSDT